MRKLTLALLVSAVAAPAFAGPIGSGLWHTEAVHQARQGAIVIAHNDIACLATVAPSVAGHSAVRAAAMKDGKLAVQLHNRDSRDAVHAIVAKACAGARIVAA